MKKFGPLLLAVALLLVVSPAMATLDATAGTTHQCWEFSEETGQYGIAPEDVDNIYGGPNGGPYADIQDISGVGVDWTDNCGVWYGEEFKIILDIPNTLNTSTDSYKTITISIRYQGDISFLWMADAFSGERFSPEGGELADSVEDGEWKIYTQEWVISPNPREEIIVIGFKSTQDVTGASVQAAVDQICIDTICVPEPATLAILTLGAGYVFVTKKRA